MGSKSYKAKKRSKSDLYLTNPVFETKFFTRKSNLFTSAFFIALIKSGIWVFPAIYASFVVSQMPFQQPFANPDDQYLMTTWFASYFANILGIKTLASFIVLHFFFAVFSIYLLYRFIRKNVELSEQGKSLLLFAMLPATTTIFYWVGMDSFTFLIMVLFLNFKKWPAFTLLIGLIGGLHHFEILFISSSSLLLFQLLRNLPKFKSKETFSIFNFLLGICLGKALLTIIFRSHNILVSKNRVSIGLDGLKTNLELITKYGFLIYWSMLGVIWFVLIVALLKRNRDSFALLISLLVPFFIVFFVRDSSRVIQLTSFLTVAFGLVSNKNVLQSISNKQVKFIFSIWILIPWVWIWQGIFSSNIAFTIKYVLSRLLNNNLAPWTGNISMWPFS